MWGLGESFLPYFPIKSQVHTYRDQVKAYSSHTSHCHQLIPGTATTMKQKIVIKASLHCPKCRTKALTIAATAPGVSSVALEGKERDQVVVTGEQVDAVTLTRLMRKKVRFASLESVQEVKEKVENSGGGKGSAAPKPTPPKVDQPPYYLPTLYYDVVYDPNPPICTIL